MQTELFINPGVLDITNAVIFLMAHKQLPFIFGLKTIFGKNVIENPGENIEQKTVSIWIRTRVLFLEGL